VRIAAYLPANASKEFWIRRESPASILEAIEKNRPSSMQAWEAGECTSKKGMSPNIDVSLGGTQNSEID